MANTNAGGGRRALFIGINAYPNLPPERQLHGCVNDVDLMSQCLIDRFGFAKADVTVLRDLEATRDAILHALDALVSATQTDDAVVIHYSGHGSQMTDREKDEPDGMDETIVPSDSGRGTSPNRDITDDELYLRFRDLGKKTGNTTLIFDCCHSASMTRDVDFGATTRTLEPDERPIKELPPSPIPASELADLVAADRGGGPSLNLPTAKRYVMISGCRDSELSNEHPRRPLPGDQTHGAMTYFLHQELSKAESGATYRDVFERVKAQVNTVFPQQTPQIEGGRDRVLFGLDELPPMKFVAVRAVRGDVVTIGAGSAYGLTAGSKWAIYPAGTKAVEGLAPIGSIRLVTVNATTADGKVEAGTDPSKIARDCRAVEVEHDYGDLRLVVEIGPPPSGLEDDIKELAAQIGASKLLRLAGSGDQADIKVAASAATWQVVDAGGFRAMPPRAIGPAAASIVCDNLEKLARKRNLIRLKNPSPSGYDKVEITLMRQEGPGAPWLDAVADRGGQFSYKEGDNLGFRIVNRHVAPACVSVLDIGLTGNIAVVYPPVGSTQTFMPNTVVNVGDRPGEEIGPLGFPDEFPIGEEGIETIKVIITRNEADFTFLEQTGVRSVEKGDLDDGPRGNPLEELFNQAATLTRDVPKKAPPEDWFTAERSFLLKRVGSGGV